MSQTREKFPELASRLRELSEDYFNGKPIENRAGICVALIRYMDHPYAAMSSLMKELKIKSAYFGPCYVTRERWENRAYMCLLLAEYLEDTQ